MRKIAILLVFAIAVFLPSLAHAGVKNVMVGGQIDMYLTFTDNYEHGAEIGSKDPSTVRANLDGSGSATSHTTTKNETFLRTYVLVNVAAELDENVKTYVAVLGDNIWGYDVDGNLDITLDEARVTMDELFGTAASATIGRQYITWGEGFLVGDSIPGSVPHRSQAHMWIVDPFDAACLTVDMDPWTVDVLYAKMDERAVRQDTQEIDEDMAGININYGGANEQSIDAYLLFAKDRNASKASAIARDSMGLFGKPYQTTAIGLRAAGEVLPVEGLTYRVEGAYQFGTFAKADAGIAKVKHSAYGGYVGANYVFGGNPYNPYVDAMWVMMTGEEKSRSGKMNEFYPFYTSKVYGELFKEYVSTNAHILKLCGGFDPTDVMNISLAYYHYIAQEDRFVSGSDSLHEDSLGNELDLTVTYKYTDDVTLGLGVAHYFPGDVFKKSCAGADSTTAITGSAKVKF